MSLFIPRHRMVWQLFSAFMLIAVLCVLAMGLLVRRPIREFYIRSQAESLEQMAYLLRPELAPALTGELSPEAVQTTLRNYPREVLKVRITLIRPDGSVMADTNADSELMEDHSSRPEVRGALAGQATSEERFSSTVNAMLIYTAVPVMDEDQVVGVLRLARPLVALDQEMQSLGSVMLRSFAVAALLAALLSLLLARRLSAPIRMMSRMAGRFAGGDFTQRIHVDRPTELAGLSDSMNRMAHLLDQRIREITRQRNELEATLASMREGVLAIDLDERILTINPAAERMLGISAAKAAGHLVQETLRHADLQKLINRMLAGEEVADQDSLLQWDDHHLLQAEATSLLDENGNRRGLLVVVNDVTRIHRLENLRREFVANVSHELRTPITSIKGFVETLQEGAMAEPETAQRFLGIIRRHADRLSAIIEDLLALSRIERQTEGIGIELSLRRLETILQGAIVAQAAKADEKRMRITLNCPAELMVRANKLLLEQAIGNLIENAIKYSDPDSEIRIEAAAANGHASIRVIDQGCGIPPQHHDRLFERFYRVDTARSRDMGGTGLGLSIVKHIAQAHGGSVAVQSEVGKGSTFMIQLPALETLTES